MAAQLDLLDLLKPPQRACGACRHLGHVLSSGVRFCDRWAVWQRPSDTPACATHEPVSRSEAA